MRVTVRGRSPIDFPLGLKVDLDKWDADAQCAVDGQPSEINRTIDEYRHQINEVFARYELLEKRTPTPQEMRDLFNDMIGKSSLFEERVVSVSDAFSEYISSMSRQNSWSDGSHKKNMTIKRHFLSAIGSASFGQITVDTMQMFVDHLLGQGLRNTTIQKDYQFVRCFLRWARKRGYYNGKAHEDYKLRLKGTDGNQKEIIYLTLEELRLLKDCQIPKQKKYLYQVRDVFLFCCYTSLRYSDARALRKSDRHGNTIRVVTQKTTDALVIELNDHARAILDRYADNHLPNDAALPVISNQRYNEYLKELGELAGIDAKTRVVYYKGNQRYDEYYPKYALLTSHCARRTFVVTALQLGIPVEVIIRWTGHSDYDAMKPYVAIVDELKRKEMDKFNSIW